VSDGDIAGQGGHAADPLLQPQQDSARGASMRAEQARHEKWRRKAHVESLAAAHEERFAVVRRAAPAAQPR
jgi:hypothetical protein